MSGTGQNGEGPNGPAAMTIWKDAPTTIVRSAILRTGCGESRRKGRVQRPGRLLGPTLVSSQALRGRAVARKSTTRCLALAVPIQAATGHCFQAMRPL